ncbi:hypothetical protein WICMUC_005325 [Wickerhamomyces mucosus]|uniref:MHD domain-containing protein n=1 Tax=Wickerhamomyces mucosus TaxID=1378264 RepID=A0A9P8P857_9ASCO|nr:hypothetical protein WICMUC_005325 [Wickerhamomyces mucosus]
MASAIAILDSEANCLISRTYTLDLIPFNEIISTFKTLLLSNKIDTPILTKDGINYLFIRNNDLIIMVTSYYNHINCMELFTFLYKFNDILATYFKSLELNKSIIIDNFNLIYELFDEIMDFGIPQLTEVSILKDVIKLEINNPELEQFKDNNNNNDDDYEDNDNNDDAHKYLNEINSSVLRSSTNAISWRSKGLYYRKNEIFVDLIEKNSLIIDKDFKKIIKNEILGEINIKCYLSGMPLLNLQLNQKFQQDLVKFNQYVNLEKYNDEKIIQFIPPDGSFQLLTYKILNIKNKPIVEIKSFNSIIKDFKINFELNLKLNIKLKSNFKKILINLPIEFKYLSIIDFTKSPKFKTNFGKVLYELKENSIIWYIDKIQSNLIDNNADIITMKCQFELFKEYSNQNNLSMDPPPRELKPNFAKIQNQLDENSLTSTKNIKIEFILENYTYSGLKISFLKILENQLNYTLFPWLRYKTINDDEYLYRL